MSWKDQAIPFASLVIALGSLVVSLVYNSKQFKTARDNVQLAKTSADAAQKSAELAKDMYYLEIEAYNRKVQLEDEKIRGIIAILIEKLQYMQDAIPENFNTEYNEKTLSNSIKFDRENDYEKLKPILTRKQIQYIDGTLIIVKKYFSDYWDLNGEKVKFKKGINDKNLDLIKDSKNTKDRLEVTIALLKSPLIQ